MANLRLTYQVEGNPVGAIIAEAADAVIHAHELMNRADALLDMIDTPADIESVLVMPEGEGATMDALVLNALTSLTTVAADMARLDQGIIL